MAKDSRRLPVCLRQSAGSADRKKDVPHKLPLPLIWQRPYLFKAYRQDGVNNNLTGIDEEDLKQVVKYTDPLIMPKPVTDWKMIIA